MGFGDSEGPLLGFNFLDYALLPVVNISIGRLRNHTSQQGQEALQVRSECFFRRLAELPRYFVSND